MTSKIMVSRLLVSALTILVLSSNVSAAPAALEHESVAASLEDCTHDVSFHRIDDGFSYEGTCSESIPAPQEL